MDLVRAAHVEFLKRRIQILVGQQHRGAEELVAQGGAVVLCAGEITRQRALCLAIDIGQDEAPGVRRTPEWPVPCERSELADLDARERGILCRAERAAAE